MLHFLFIIAAVESRGVAGGGGSAADRLSGRIIPGNDVGHRQGTVKSHRISQFTIELQPIQALVISM